MTKKDIKLLSLSLSDITSLVVFDLKIRKL